MFVNFSTDPEASPDLFLMEDPNNTLSKQLGFLKKDNILDSKVNVRRHDLILLVQVPQSGSSQVKKEETYQELFYGTNRTKKCNFRLAISKKEMQYSNSGDVKIVPIGFTYNMLGDFFLSQAGTNE